MKTLRLTLKKKWFDMILSGEKKEEYREIKEYWCKRFATPIEWRMESYIEPDITDENGIGYQLKSNEYERIEFINGYSKNAPRFTIECKGIEIANGNIEWGAEHNVKYFVIKLGQII